jgi:predicted phosphodiesterase
VRYGLLADIHGNLDALRAVLRALDRVGIDRYLVAGDLVGYGPFPNECVATVAELDAVCVAGNHDLIALGRLSDGRCIELARRSLAWTRNVLRPDVREFLAALPLRAAAPGAVIVAHGSFDDPQEYTTTKRQARAQLRQLEEGADGRLLVLGHTHRPLAFARDAGWLRTRDVTPLPRGEAVLLNPGAVGQSRELLARARFAVIDLEAERASFTAIRYDVDACRTALRRAGLSERSCHLRPSAPRAGARAVRTYLLRRGPSLRSRR